MAGMVEWKTQISLDIEDLKKRVKIAEGELDRVSDKQRKVKLDIDTKTLESAIQKLDKMLDSLGKGTGDFKQFENLSKELSSIVSEVQSLSKAFGKVDDSGAKTLLSSIQNIDKSLSELSQNIFNVNKNMSNMGGNTSGVVKQVENITNESKKAASALEDVAKAQSKVNNGKINTSSGTKDAFPDKDVSASVESTANSIKEENNVLKQNTQKVKENTQAKKENANVNLNKYNKRLDSYNGKVTKYKTTIDRLKDGGWASDAYEKNVNAVEKAVGKYETLLNELKNKDASLVTNKDIQTLKEYEGEIKKTISTVQNMSAAEKGYDAVSGQKELDKIHKLLNENSKMSSKAKAQIKAFYKEIESGNPSMSLNKIHAEIMKIVNAEVEAGRGGKSMWSAIKEKAWYGAANAIGTYFSFNDIIRYGQQVASIVTDINTQITELAKVSEQSSKQIYSDFDSYADIAKEVRGTISDTIAATADWSKNGYSIPDAKQLAEVSQLYKNVGDGIDIDTANESLISTLKGFQLEADQAEHIVDVFNEVSNNEAISSGGIGDALQRSAASFNAANTSLEKSVALVTATNSVLQDPEKVGCTYIADLYSNVMKIKVARSVNIQKWTRPSKDLYVVI